MDAEYIAGIFAAEGHRGKGMGRRLIAEVKRKKRLSLHVYEKNAGAVTFYQAEQESMGERQEMENISYRNRVLETAAEQYHTVPEQLWAKYPEHVVLRHSNNKKWYALVMNVSRSKLGLEGEEYVDILNLKSDPVMTGSFQFHQGIMPGYHMNKEKWITVLLDGTVPMNVIELLLDTSFALTNEKKSKKQTKM